MRAVGTGFLLALLWAPAAPAAVDIVVSIPPLEYFVQHVGSGHVRVRTMVQPGHSPVTYEPTPRQMTELSSARAFVRIGVPFESRWLPAIRDANPDMDIVDARSGIGLLPATAGPASAEGKDGGHDHSGADPHIWLDPALAGIITGTIRDYLIGIDPDHGADYRRNAGVLLDELAQLDAEIRAMIARVKDRRFLVFHPAWGYFAKAYGLQQIAVEHEGKEPGPQSLATLLDFIKREHVRTIFVQKQFGTRVAETLAGEINGNVVVLDPLAKDYVSNLRAAAQAIARTP